MSAGTAFNVFARAVVRERKIPFPIQAYAPEREAGKSAFAALRRQARENGLAEMSPDDINREIDAALADAP